MVGSTLWVPIQINGIPVNAIIDMGAETTILSWNVALKIIGPNEIEKLEKVLLRGFGNAKMTSRR